MESKKPYCVKCSQDLSSTTVCHDCGMPPAPLLFDEIGYKRAIEIAREHFPDTSENTLNQILWRHTEFPYILPSDEDKLHSQLRAWKTELHSQLGVWFNGGDE